MAHIREHVDLREFNTFGIPVTAAYFTTITSAGDFRELLEHPVYQDRQRLVLGGGSNILFTGDFNGLVIRNGLRGKEIVREDDTHAFVKAAAGEVWHELVMWTLKRNLGGLENLSLIPGFVGAGPMQNIGAYGVEIRDVFESLEAFDMETGAVRVFRTDECEFGYRESVFKRKLKDKYLIASVTFKLSKRPVVNTTYGAINQQLALMKVTNPTISDVSDAVIAIRRSKLPDPAVTGNAGSFFKNPEVNSEVHGDLKRRFPELVSYPFNNGFKLAAGWLIEQSGLKGFEMNGAAVHDRQALVLVNRGNATGNDVYALSAHVLKVVKEKFGVELEREVNII